ncbi:hypothetical protein GE061_004658 [Apolygus lucorum]|uniref:Cytochrome P450 n=1 Tax=Apolygus lucorum TaxID=248454 RepID=A0A8S9WZC0_APOLU|nr:hypothetical protein GE061_004658 [Apolygus lucorum]
MCYGLRGWAIEAFGTSIVKVSPHSTLTWNIECLRRILSSTMDGALIIAGILSVFVFLVLVAIKRNQYWSDQGVRQWKPLLFVGDVLPVILRRQTFGQLIMEICRALPNEPVIGFYFFMKPILIMNDIELVQRVFVKDFPHFTNRRRQPDVERDPQQFMHMTLFNTNGKLWRAIRSKFQPMFTNGKLKLMFPQVLDISDYFIELLKKESQNTNKIDMTEYFGKFTMEVLGATAFGLNGRAMDENSEFRENGKKLIEPSLANFMRYMVAPSLVQTLGIPPMPGIMRSYFGRIVKNALKTRRESNVKRHDFLQHMVTLQEKGFIEVEKEDANEEMSETERGPEMKVEMSDELMIGQASGFILAGFDTTALTMAWMCYDLASNPEIQTKIREEAREVLSKHGNRMDYDTTKEMKYLIKCLKESSRLHVILDAFFRMVSKPYNVPGTSAVLRTGDYVYIPVLDIHMNPKFYPDPEKFDPERWTEDDRPACTHLPFGAGPRVCIGTSDSRYTILL